jgi:hypothetical protein
MDEKLREIFLPTHILSKIFGMSPLSYQKGHFAYSKLGVAQTIIYLAIFATITVGFLEEHNTQIATQLVDIKTPSFVVPFRIISNIILMVVVFGSVCFKGKKFLREMENLIQFESDFANLDQNEYISRRDKTNRRISIILCVVEHLIFNICGGFLAAPGRRFFATKSFGEKIWAYAMVMYPRFIINNFNIIFFVTEASLQTRFAAINNVLKKKIEESKKVDVYPRVASFCEEIEHLVVLHKSLVKTGKSFNSIFATHMLIWIAITFVLVVGDCYIIMYTFLFHLDEVDIIDILNLFKNITMHAFNLFVLSQQSENLCQEVDQISSENFFLKIAFRPTLPKSSWSK